MLHFATDSVREFHPHTTIGDANGGLLEELAFANLGFDPIRRRTGFVPVTELPAPKVSVVESDDEPEQNIGNAGSHFKDRYAAMAENLGLSESEWKTLEDQLDQDRYDDQENYYSRPWEIEAHHDEFVEAFDREIEDDKRQRLHNREIGFTGLVHITGVWISYYEKIVPEDYQDGIIEKRARRGKGDGRRSRRPVPTHHAFGLVMHEWFSPLDEDYDFVPLIDPDEIREELDAEAEFYEDEYQNERQLYLTKFYRWDEPCFTERSDKWLLCIHEYWTLDDYLWHLTPDKMGVEVDYLRWVRKVNLPTNSEATIIFDKWLHDHGECASGCLVCKHEEEEAHWREQRELSALQYYVHEFGDCHPEHCEFCAEEHARYVRAYLWDQHERGLCSRDCVHCEQEHQWELEAEAYERQIEAQRMRAIDERDRLLEDLHEYEMLKLMRERIKFFEQGYRGGLYGAERSYRGKQWQRHKPRHKPTVPTWVHFEPVSYEDDILVAA